MKKLFLLILALSFILVLTSCEVVALFHDCVSACPECGKCRDLNCVMEICAEKCDVTHPPHEHSLTKVEEVPATCEVAGVESYYTCKCGKLFADEAAQNEIEAPVVIEALGHSYGALEKIDDESHKASCSCGHVKTEAHAFSETGRIDATHTADGKVDYSCACGMTKSETLDKLEGCSYNKEVAEAKYLKSEATCINGNIYYKSCVCGKFSNAEDAETFEDTERADHIVEALPATDPGCIAVGKTEGSHCSVCKEVFKAQENIAPTGAHSWEGLNCKNCPATKFEAESADITCVMPEGETKVVSTGREGKTPAQTNYPSGDSFVYFMSYSDTTTLKFYVTASKAGKATISVRMGLATSAAKLENLFYVQVNGVKMESRPDVVFPAYNTNSIKYYDWLELEISDIQLQAGANIIEIIKPIPSPDEENPYVSTHGLNFDYMTICPADEDMILQDTRDYTLGQHSYTEGEIMTAPTLTATGEFRAYCENCRLYQTIELPKVSADSYTKISTNGMVATWEYTYGGNKYSFTATEASEKYYFISNTESDPFASANGGAVLTEGVASGLTEESGSIFYPNTKDTTHNYTMKLCVAQATTIKLYVGAAKNNSSLAPDKILQNLKVNGATTGVTYSTTKISWTNNSPANWFIFKDSYIATIELKAGENTITFDVIKTSLNLDKVIIEASIPVTLSGGQGAHQHSYTVEKASANALCSAADCYTPASYYKSCSCGLVGNADTFISGAVREHSFVNGSCEYACGTHLLTLDKATAPGLEGTDGVYAVKEGTSVTIKANQGESHQLFIGFERDYVANSHTETGDSGTYTFTMPGKPTYYASVYNSVNLVLESALVKNGLSVSKSVATYTNGGSSKTFTKYYVTKGTTTDGTYIYVILNAKTGSKAGTGFDVGIIAKFDKTGKFLNVTTSKAYQWGNVPKLAYVDGYLIVTNTNATAYSGYNDTKVYNGKTLKFNTNLELVDDNYLPTYPDAPEGKLVAAMGQRQDGSLCVVYDSGVNKGEYTICIYEKNGTEYSLVAENSSTELIKSSLKENARISGIVCADKYVYLLFSATNHFSVKLMDYSGRFVFEKTLSKSGETNAASSNYQGLFAIGDKIYYSLANWGDYEGFGLYSVDFKFTYERVLDNANSSLTLKGATVEGFEGTNGVYIIPAGTTVTIKANATPDGCIFAGFERDGIAGSHEETGNSGTYTFVMPSKAVSFESVYLSEQLVIESSLVKNGISVNKTVSSYTSGGAGISFSQYYVTKGTTTDGTYIYAILNAKTGSDVGTGYDVGIIAKFDKNGNFLGATTANAYQWGAVAKLSYVDGYLIVSNTYANACSTYGDTKVYNGKNLKFNTNLELIDDNYLPSYPDAPEGKIVAVMGQRADGYLAVIYDVSVNGGDYTVCIYKKNASGIYELVAKNDSDYLDAMSNLTPAGKKSSIASVCCADDNIYILYYTTNFFKIKALDYSGNLLFDKGLSKTAETEPEKSNYQGIFQIDGQLYYALINWNTYPGLGIYALDMNYTYVRVYQYTVSFDLNGADAVIDSQKIWSDGKVEKPSAPTYTYTNPNGVTYTFVLENWYNGEKVWNFDTDVVTSDLTLKARWVPQDDFFAEKENAAVRAEGTDIRAMSFNVLCDDYNNKPAVAPRVDGVVNTIMKYLPDVAGLQECDDQWYAALTANAQFSAKYRFVNYATTGENKITYNGTARTNYSTIIYNTEVLELVEWTQQYLATFADNYNCRTLTIAVFKVKESGERFIFMSLHWGLKLNERITQANAMKAVIDDWKAKYPDAPVIISGDYNAYDSEESISILLSQNNMTDSKNAEATGTVCKTGHLGSGMLVGERDKTNPDHWIRGRFSVNASNLLTTEAIDHIMITPDVKSLYFSVIHDDDALDSSDHMPIYCDLKFTKE